MMTTRGKRIRRSEARRQLILARDGVFGYDCRAFREPAPVRGLTQVLDAGDGTALLAVSRLAPGTRASCKGRVPLDPMLANILHALEVPAVAIVSGLVLAAAMLAASRGSFRLVTPEHTQSGLALAALALFARLALATAILWAYKSFAPLGIKPFAITFAGGFLLLYTFELVRFSGLRRYRRPVVAGRE